MTNISTVLILALLLMSGCVGTIQDCNPRKGLYCPANGYWVQRHRKAHENGSGIGRKCWSDDGQICCHKKGWVRCT